MESHLPLQRWRISSKKLPRCVLRAETATDLADTHLIRNWFSPHHGKGPADAHASLIKHVAKNLIKKKNPNGGMSD
jgi:hypothetical protein